MNEIKSQSIKISELKPHPKNYRNHPEDQIQHLAKSLYDNGQYRNVVTARDNTILAGHGLVLAAKELKWTDINIIKLDIDSNDPRALKILTGDNEIGRLAEIDDRKLTETLKEILDLDDLLGTGFDSNMLSALVLTTRPEHEIQDINKAAEWVGMPEYIDQISEFKITVHFDTEKNKKKFFELLDQEYDKNIKYINYPKKAKRDMKSVRFEKNGK